MKLVICSKKDIASQNIKNAMLNILDFEKRSIDGVEFYFSEKLIIAEVEERLIYADRIDERLSKLVEFDELVFISRHSSKDGRKIVTVHSTGNVGRAEFGGKPYSLAKPSPLTMKNFALLASKKVEETEYEFTMEATHHGPSEISLPSAFYEIGSTEEEWRDEEIANLVAESILGAVEKLGEWKVAVGVGGTHYIPRQTEIEVSTIFAFAHNFPKYTFNDLSKEFLEYAFDLSDAELFIIDEKSVNSRIKSLVKEVAEKKGVEVLKSKEAKKHVI